MRRTQTAQWRTGSMRTRCVSRWRSSRPQCRVGMQIAGTVADDLAAKDDETWGKDGAGRLSMHAEIAAAAAAMGSGKIGGAVAATVAGDLASDALVASGGNALAGNIAAGAAGAAG